MIHLDTNVVIALLNNAPTPVRPRFESARAARTPMRLSTIVFHELMFGAANSKRRRDNEAKLTLFLTSAGLTLLPFEDADATEAADIRGHLKREGTPIGPYDVLIAGQARRAGAALVTANGREFDRVPGLIVRDWAA